MYFQLFNVKTNLDDLENQVESQKLIIKSYEDNVAATTQSSGKSLCPGVPKFELGKVPKTKSSMARSPDVSRKPLISPKEIVQCNAKMSSSL